MQKPGMAVKLVADTGAGSATKIEVARIEREAGPFLKRSACRWMTESDLP